MKDTIIAMIFSKPRVNSLPSIFCMKDEIDSNTAPHITDKIIAANRHTLLNPGDSIKVIIAKVILPGPANRAINKSCV